MKIIFKYVKVIQHLHKGGQEMCFHLFEIVGIWVNFVKISNCVTVHWTVSSEL
jgi:hypothetical protein